jgi:hypothetical protein
LLIDFAAAQRANMRSVNGRFMFIDSQLTRFSARQSRCLSASP